MSRPREGTRPTLDTNSGTLAGSGSLVDNIHRGVRTAILAGRYKPGEAISEVGVAALYDVARPTARAAVERLVAEGLLVRSGRKAAEVPIFSDQAIENIYSARILIEGHAHRSLAERRLVPPDAVAANSALRANAANGLASGMIDADVAFHTALVRAQGNAQLLRLHGILMGEAHLLMAQVQTQQLLRADTIADEHAAIIQAIARNSPDEAYDLTEYHLQHAQAKLLGSDG